jgi:sugar transferase (PEP-CTERM system associated)
MVRLFHVYYPVRSLVLLGGEIIIVCFSFVLATVFRFGPESYLTLSYENGFYKILCVTGCSILCFHCFDLYAPQKLGSKSELYVRLLVVLGTLAFLLGLVSYVFPKLMVGKGVYVIGLLILTFALLIWRGVYSWLLQQPVLRERVYVLGSGERAERLVRALRKRTDLGLDVVGWMEGGANGESLREHISATISRNSKHRYVDQVVVAMPERRGQLPVRDLLDLRVSGIRVQDAHSLLEKIYGYIEIDDLNPSALIFADGFRLNPGFMLARRLVSVAVAVTILLLCLPIIPLIVLAIRLTSPGSILFRQQRVGRAGEVFTLYKFRTMKIDAEAECGPKWADDDDPRVTGTGKFLRVSRLDEIPQLWNVLKGDMGFVGPRPERPEFVQWLANAVPYYNMRHIIRPGITGWAQVRYQYGASIQQTKEKLQYDLYYIKHMSLMFDLLIMVETLKTVLQARGR